MDACFVCIYIDIQISVYLYTHKIVYVCEYISSCMYINVCLMIYIFQSTNFPVGEREVFQTNCQFGAEQVKRQLNM